MRPRVPRFDLGLLGRFALFSLVPVLCLAVILQQVLGRQIRERAVEQARSEAIVLATVAVHPVLDEQDFLRGLTPTRIAQLDVALAPALVSSDLARLKVIARDGTIRYSDDRLIIGHRGGVGDHLAAALAGRSSSHVTEPHEDSEGGLGTLLETYVPVSFEGTSPVGAVEVYRPYAPVAAQIAHDTRTLYAVLLLGLVVLWAALFRLFTGVSRQLRRQAVELASRAEENRHLALHDALTGLPNRSLFTDRIAGALADARRRGGQVGVLLMDLDRFKEVNDTLGHHIGDVLLEQVAVRVRDALRGSDSVARLGGDEFGILVPNLLEEADAVEVACRIAAALEAPVVVDGLPLRIETSIGIALSPDHGDDVDTLLQRADVAMYAAKAGAGPWALYDPAVDGYDPRSLALVGELREALEAHEIVPYYQPKGRATDAEVVGVEVLIRWEHPTRGLLFPDEFIPLAQQTGLIRPLTHYVIDAALRDARAWRDAGRTLSVAVNLAMRNLLDSDLPADVAGLLHAHGLPASALQFEITEGTIMTDPPRALDVLTRLSSMGVRLSIDDFGTGYSSLSYLKSLPVDELKIDKSFVFGMRIDSSDLSIVRSTIDLARNLGLEVVAEGVETAEVWADLEALGCDLIQGYRLSRPVPAADLVTWLDERDAARTRPQPA